MCRYEIKLHLNGHESDNLLQLGMKKIDLWCNGSTRDFDSHSLVSNTGRSMKFSAFGVRVSTRVLFGIYRLGIG